MTSIYNELPEHGFRLLELAPASQRSDPLVGELINVIASDAVRYNALSYVWGDPADPREVLVSGTKVKISLNLDRGLRRIRDRSQSVILWVDQICINQKNADERAHQVGYMDKIYGHAEEVLVHLCPCPGEDEDDHQPIEGIARPTIPFFDRMVDLYKLSLDTHRSDTGLKGDESLAFSQILQARWWTRMWTTQEIVFARNLTFFYHKRSVSGKVLQHFCQWWKLHMMTCCAVKNTTYGMLNVELSVSLDRVVDILEVRSNYLAKGSSPTLLDMLVKTQDRIATEPNDKVFALSGLTEFPISMIDYKMSPQKCFTRIAKFIIDTSGRLDIFQHLNRSDLRIFAGLWKEDPEESVRRVEKLNHLPSWVPDWSISGTSFSDIGLNRYHEVLSHYGAAGDTIAQSKQHVDGGLILRGVRYTTISNLDIAFGQSSSVEQTLTAVLELWGNLKGFPNYFGTNLVYSMLTENDWFPLFAHHIVTEGDRSRVFKSLSDGSLTENKYTDFPVSVSFKADDVRSSFVYSVIYKTLAQNHKNNELATRIAEEIGLPSDEIESLLSEEIWKTLHLIDRRLISTTDGKYGIAPAKAQPGDHVCVLYGGNTPFILREKKPRKRCKRRSATTLPEMDTQQPEKEPVRRYQMIGEAYIHGLMCGEAIDDLRKGLKSEEEFILV